MIVIKLLLIKYGRAFKIFSFIIDKNIVLRDNRGNFWVSFMQLNVI